MSVEISDKENLELKQFELFIDEFSSEDKVDAAIDSPGFDVKCIKYEQPLNEQIRLCLRLDHLFHKVEHARIGDSVSRSRDAIHSLVQLVQVSDRPDLKSKLITMLKQIKDHYSKMMDKPQVDQNKLILVLDQAEHYIRQLTSADFRLADQIKKIELLNNIRMQQINPAGDSVFSLPEYYLWLHRSSEERKADIKTWSDKLKDLRLVICFILKLIRQNSFSSQEIAAGGFYQSHIDSSLGCQIVEVKVGKNIGVYPKFSVGRNHLSFHFMHLNEDKIQKVVKDIPFELSFFCAG